MSEHTPLALLQRGDLDGLLAFHRSNFGTATMTAPAGDPEALAQGASENGPAGQQQQPLQLVPQGQQPPAQPAFTPTGRTFTEDDLEKARKQEKDKLYPQIESMGEELKRLREAEEQRTALAQTEAQQRAEAQKEQERLAREAAEAEMSAKELLEAQRREFDERFAQIEQERMAERRALELERQYSELQQYRARRLGEEQENIIPELLDLITGNTQDEIEQSIAGLRDRSARIIEAAAGAAQATRQQMRGAPVTAPPGIGPSDNNSGYQSYSPQDIAAMSYADYAKNRDKILGAVTQSRSNERGLYG